MPEVNFWELDEEEREGCQAGKYGKDRGSILPGLRQSTASHGNKGYSTMKRSLLSQSFLGLPAIVVMLCLLSHCYPITSTGTLGTYAPFIPITSSV